mgnify:CR=1 FL=1
MVTTELSGVPILMTDFSLSVAVGGGVVGLVLSEALPLLVDKLIEYRLRDRIRVIASGKLINTVRPMPYEAPYRPLNPVSSYALAASRHMHAFGTTKAQLGKVHVAIVGLTPIQRVIANDNGVTTEQESLLAVLPGSVGTLVERSMVTVDPGPFGRRFRLLETMRQFAAEHLREHRHADLAAERHARWCVREVAHIHRLLTGPSEIEGVARLADLWANLRAAVTWACTAGDPRLADALVRPLVTFLLWAQPFAFILVFGAAVARVVEPRRASLEAAVNPADVPYLYFVSRNDGSHVFARTLAEHNRNVREWQIEYFRRQRQR